MSSSEIATIENIALALQQGKTCSVDLVNTALARIQDPLGQGGVVFTRVFDQIAREQAVASDERRAAGHALSMIDGVPICVKDLFDVAGYTTMAGSVVLSDWVPATEDAVIVQRLHAAGAIVVGTTNMTEFAYSGLGLNPHYGTPLSPWDRATGRIAGGSSSGAAAAVADGMAVAAIGTDTGGSVRIPAAFCGVVGYKPTASRIDMRGALPLSLSLDSIGPMSHSVTGCAWLADIMAGDPVRTPSSISIKGLRLGIPNQLVLNDMDETVSASFTAACRLLADEGVEIIAMDLPELDELATINSAGGYTAAQAWMWHRELLSHRQSQYDPRVAIRIMRGAALADDYLKTLDAQRANWIERVKHRISSVDALLMPTVPIVPPELSRLEAEDDHYSKTNLLALRNPSVVNFFDGCAVSLPCHEPNQPPVGLMLAAAADQDQRLLSIAMASEELFNQSLGR